MTKIKWKSNGVHVATHWYSGDDPEHLQFNGRLMFDHNQWEELQLALLHGPDKSGSIVVLYHDVNINV